MKHKLSIVFAIVLLGAIPVLGQGGRGQGQGQGAGRGEGGGEFRGQMTEENVKERVERLAVSLEMNDDQKEKILDFELEAFKTNQVERQRLRGDREAMRSYMMKQREERDKKYGEVLTDEQYKKFKAQQEQRRQDFQNRERPDSQGDRPARGRGRG